MKTKTTILFFYILSLLFSQTSVGSEEVRNIRIENFKENYIGKTIQFLGSDGLWSEGVLVDVTSKKFTLLMDREKLNFDNININHVYIMPKKAEFLLASSLALFGGAVSYLTLLVLRDEADYQQKASFICVGFVLGGLLGKRTFYKPLKIDISGRVYD